MDRKSESYKEFCKSLEKMRSEDGFPLENVTTVRFLEAMQSWLADTDGGEDFFSDPGKDYLSWDDLEILLRASAIYE